jgi:hypothetical protein
MKRSLPICSIEWRRRDAVPAHGCQQSRQEQNSGGAQKLAERLVPCLFVLRRSGIVAAKLSHINQLVTMQCET